ncbi:MFS transporter [Gallaecimonas pentaromativorans]|uniref:1-acyl-sn-glycerol-3-phosphate acyltransferase n=1 Tax=Gallaecimonas pentaromativorans TaxID=584787 RepID=A0A3N1PIU2_9GAMM|nr:MFS transporter [Gallaecimonas pentaromativorans]ROQ28513.1 1-acyl-sn-glycerol-3-phosphate acyltransferase [Gallaecimonas pentaromativorans]
MKALLSQRRFGPLFFTQALGAANDNLFKNALMLLLTFGGSQLLPWQDSSLTVNIAAGLFILPFLLFSATAGSLADSMDKARLIRYIKLWEILIMAGAVLALWAGQYLLLLGVLFLMGSQSAFFGPVKYAILPQLLKPSELVAGNAWVEMGTFVAILLGTIAGGLVVGMEAALRWLSVGLLVLAVAGYLAARLIPAAPASPKAQPFQFKPWQQSREMFRIGRQNRTLFLSLMAISWFWFLGAGYLTQFANYARLNLGGDNTVVTALLVAFSVGVAIGSMLCERLSGGQVELGLVPIGSVGLTLFGLDLAFASPTEVAPQLMGLGAYLAEPYGWRVLIDLTLIGVFGGLFIVPLYALLQSRADEDQRARVIAANNVMNALFMVASALFGILFLSVMELSIDQYFGVLAIMNAAVALYVYFQLPEFVLRLCIWLLSHSFYRVKSQGLAQIPKEGPALLVCNHVSFVDALLLAGSCRRPVRFVMDKSIYQLPVLNWLFKVAKTIPICSQKQDPDTYQRAFERIDAELAAGEVVCIFPEGKLTRDGNINSFRPGVEKILEQRPVPVVPMALKGLWGSFFSHQGKGAFKPGRGRFWSKIAIVAGPALDGAHTDAAELEAQVRGLRGEQM